MQLVKNDIGKFHSSDSMTSFLMRGEPLIMFRSLDTNWSARGLQRVMISQPTVRFGQRCTRFQMTSSTSFLLHFLFGFEQNTSMLFGMIFYRVALRKLTPPKNPNTRDLDQT